MNQTATITYVIFLIFTGTAILSTMALFTRQSLLVAYIALGAIMGPYGLKLLDNSIVIRQAGDIGIIFLLFLLGLDLQPQNLYHSLRKMSLITLSSSLCFFLIGALTCYFFNYPLLECFLIGIVTMFSSTIIGLKLLPTTTLHHQHTGELVISILLLQDLIAIAVLLVLEMVGTRGGTVAQFGLLTLAFPVLFGLAYLFQRYVLSQLLTRFDKIHEYIFILSVGWCLFMAQLSHAMGLSEQIGAFIAGIALASNPIAYYIAECLKPLRDFFLVIFFFSVGASFDFALFTQIIIPALTLAGLVIVLKPLILKWLLFRSGEVKAVSQEIGVRLGQMSEFSLLVIYLCASDNLLSPLTAHMVEAAVIITFIVSCYWIVMRYPTPLAASDKLRRD